MEVDWQTIIALVLVALAAGVVARRAVTTWRGASKKSCSGCAGCGDDSVKSLPLVELGDSRAPKPRL